MKDYIMSYQYARLAVGRKKEYRDAWVAVPCDRYGLPLPSLSDDDELIKYGSRKVLDYDIKNGAMLCYLDVDP